MRAGTHQRLGRDLPAHLHQALAEAPGGVRQAAAFGLAVHDGRHLRRIAIRRLRRNEPPEVRLQIDQNGRTEGCNALVHQPDLRPVVVHESRVGDAAQIALAVRSHLVQREHRNRAVSLDGLRGVRDVRPVGTVPAGPGACANAHEVGVHDVRTNALALHLREGIARAESDQHPSGLAELGHQRGGRRDGRSAFTCATGATCATAALAIATLADAITALAATAAGQATALSTAASATAATAGKQEHRKHQCRNASLGKHHHEKGAFEIERRPAAAHVPNFDSGDPSLQT